MEHLYDGNDHSLNVRGASRAVDAHMIQFHDKEGSNQRWHLTKVRT